MQGMTLPTARGHYHIVGFWSGVRDFLDCATFFSTLGSAIPDLLSLEIGDERRDCPTSSLVF